jgi:hypothetical protein
MEERGLSSKAFAAREGEGFPRAGRRRRRRHAQEEEETMASPEKKHREIRGRGSTGGRRRALRPPSPVAELPRAAVSMADGREHEVAGLWDGVASICGLGRRRLELPATRSCGGGDWSSAVVDWSFTDRRRRGGVGTKQQGSRMASRRSGAWDGQSSPRQQ